MLCIGGALNGKYEEDYGPSFEVEVIKGSNPPMLAAEGTTQVLSGTEKLTYFKTIYLHHGVEHVVYDCRDGTDIGQTLDQFL